MPPTITTMSREKLEAYARSNPVDLALAVLELIDDYREKEAECDQLSARIELLRKAAAGEP